MYFYPRGCTQITEKIGDDKDFYFNSVINNYNCTNSHTQWQKIITQYLILNELEKVDRSKKYINNMCIYSLFS
jgi:hypothetical protein